LLPITIKGGKSMIVWTQVLFDLRDICMFHQQGVGTIT
jgi:hypothetical protein